MVAFLFTITVLASIAAGLVLGIGLSSSASAPQQAAVAAIAVAVVVVPYVLARMVQILDDRYNQATRHQELLAKLDQLMGARPKAPAPSAGGPAPAQPPGWFDPRDTA